MWEGKKCLWSNDEVVYMLFSRLVWSNTFKFQFIFSFYLIYWLAIALGNAYLFLLKIICNHEWRMPPAAGRAQRWWVCGGGGGGSTVLVSGSFRRRCRGWGWRAVTGGRWLPTDATSSISAASGDRQLLANTIGSGEWGVASSDCPQVLPTQSAFL